MYKRFCRENLKEKDCWEDLGLKVRITVKEDIKIVVQAVYTREEKRIRQLYYLE